MILPKESATFSSCRFNFFRLSLIPNSRYWAPVIEDQLLAGGLRLARLLNDAFTPAE